MQELIAEMYMYKISLLYYSHNEIDRQADKLIQKLTTFIGQR